MTARLQVMERGRDARQLAPAPPGKAERLLPPTPWLVPGNRYSYWTVCIVARFWTHGDRSYDTTRHPTDLRYPRPSTSPLAALFLSGPRLWNVRTLEETLCREVASVAAAFEMKSSHWNGSIGEGRAVFEVYFVCHIARH